MQDLRSMNIDDFESLMIRYKEKIFRAKQLFKWIHNKGITNLLDTSNISNQLIKRLIDDNFKINVLELITRQISVDQTEKYLFKLSDGNFIETVLMKYRGDYSKKRNTLCVSSQVGCAMNCSFCQTGKQGFTRNLTVGEIVSQVYYTNHLLNLDNEPMSVRNIVFMGMGEPFANYDNVIKAIQILCHKDGLNLAPRRITISTCGLVSEIKKFAELQTDVGLAVSLHASNDTIRKSLMPITHKYSLNELLNSLKYYQGLTNKRISFEYALIHGVNDLDQNIEEIKKIVYGIDCMFNLIPVNPTSNKSLLAPSKEVSRRFQAKLEKNGIPATIREAKGADIEGACGQLTSRYLKSRFKNDGTSSYKLK